MRFPAHIALATFVLAGALHGQEPTAAFVRFYGEASPSDRVVAPFTAPGDALAPRPTECHSVPPRP
ncbi:MAG TPA: hypothetical protein VEV39_08325 [Gemmatimonadales bacterium]|nr:hypothetical protein [Gemmatimonadales bacterium]